jgi:hypothetical protein
MLVSIASLVPIVVVGPIADLLGTTTVIVAIGLAVVTLGVLSIIARGALRPRRAAHAAVEAGGFFDTAAVAAGSETHVAAAEQPILERSRARAAGPAGSSPGRVSGPAPGALDIETEGYDAGVPVLGGSAHAGAADASDAETAATERAEATGAAG